MDYAYENLEDQRFQHLCQALLLEDHPDLQCIPVRQSDGGIDALVRSSSSLHSALIFQVKQSDAPKTHDDPVGWLESTLESESKHFAALKEKGAREYVIVTNVPGTAHPEGGRITLLNKKCDDLTLKYGLPIRGLWRDDLDRRMDRAPDALRNRYSEVLIGPDAIRALLSSALSEGRFGRQAGLLKAAAAAEWSDDSAIRFSEVALEQPLNDLFVDVTVKKRTTASAPGGDWQVEVEPPRGAATMLLGSPPRRAAIVGGPGQGKSTLVQFICQANRAVLLEKSEFLDDLPKPLRAVDSRIPFRVELRRFSRMVQGFDPFADSDDHVRLKSSEDRSLESYMARQLQHACGGSQVDVDDIREIFQRFPCLLALDGLDEVANVAVREKVMKAIDKAIARLSAELRPLVLITTRPNITGRADSVPSNFETFELQPLDEKLRAEYMRKWAVARGLSSSDRRSLTRIFRERSGEEHVKELATNPMQLAILAYLITQRTESLPRDRTQLYQDYMTRFLDREVNKDAVVREHRELLEEITQYLGWFMQAQAEEAAGDGRLELARIQQVIRHYLADTKRDPGLGSELFTAATERVWAITSRSPGYFEFDVQPVREFFAAKYLYETAYSDATANVPSRVHRLLEMAPRPYWFNTMRFFAGMFPRIERLSLLDFFEDESGRPGRQISFSRVLRILNQDGIFDVRPRAVENAVRICAEPVGLRTFVDDLAHGAAPVYGVGRGREQFIQRMQADISAEPSSSLNLERVAALSHHVDATQWWVSQILSADATSRSSWLKLARHSGWARKLSTSDLERLADGDARFSAQLVEAGARAAPGTAIEAQFLDLVLDGEVAISNNMSSSLPVDALRVLAPSRFADRTRHDGRFDDSQAVKSAMSNLRKNQGKWLEILKASRQTRGQKGTTSVWSNVARAIQEGFGERWLGNAIAVIGAAAGDLSVGGDIDPDAVAFGDGSDPATLARDARVYADKADWWIAQSELCDSDRRIATWLLAVTACAREPVLDAVGKAAAEMQLRLSRSWANTLARTSLVVGASGTARELSPSVAESAAPTPMWAALLNHYVANEHQWRLGEILGPDHTSSLQEVRSLGAPILESRTRHTRVIINSEDALRPFRAAGPRLMIPNIPIEFAVQEANEVVSSASDFPYAFVVAADRALLEEPALPLGRLAAQEGWFEDPWT